MPQDNKPPASSETIRIDLLQVEKEGGVGKPGQPAIPRLQRMNWSRPSRLLDSVVRARYQDLLQSVYDAALITDLSGQIVDTNSRAVEFFQFEQSDLCSMAIYELIAGADDTLMEMLSDSLKNERFTVIQAYCVRRDGATFAAEIAVNKLRLDKLRLCFFVRDVTIRMQAQEMLRKEHAAIHNAGYSMVIADLDCALEYANPAFARMLDYASTDELLGRDVREFLSDRVAADALVDHVTRASEPRTDEMVMKRRDGSELFVQASAACSRDADGQPIGIVLSFADVTAHRQAEEALRTAQAELERRDDARTQELLEANRRLEQELADARDENERLRQMLAAQNPTA